MAALVLIQVSPASERVVPCLLHDVPLGFPLQEGWQTHGQVGLPGTPGRPLQVGAKGRCEVLEGCFAGESTGLHEEHVETSRCRQGVLSVYSCMELPPCQRETAPESLRGSCSGSFCWTLLQLQH